ncbi:xanthine dehydrogenase large subunit [Acinetobacter baumannii]|nr:xanthine dehydrogenase large subunit [Acinetobacter baumannii]
MTLGSQLTLQLILGKLKVGLCKGWDGSRQKSCIGSRRVHTQADYLPMHLQLTKSRPVWTFLIFLMSNYLIIKIRQTPSIALKR